MLCIPPLPRWSEKIKQGINMHYDHNVFISQFPIAKRFVYHLTYYKILHKMYQKNDLKCEFWIHTIDAHLLQAAILWCMIFGSDGPNNPTHWKKLSSKKTESLKKSFRDGLLISTQMNREQWQKYHTEMVNFRNEFAAHRELKYKKPVPNFDYALKVVYYYDQWIREIIAPDTFEEPLLKETAKKLDKTELLINSLMVSSKEYNEV